MRRYGIWLDGHYAPDRGSLDKQPHQEEALRWLEFRQHWKLFPWLSGVLFFGWFFLKFFDRVTLASVLEAMQWSALIALALAGFSVAGFFCSMPGDSPKTNRGPFCSTNPRRPWN